MNTKLALKAVSEPRRVEILRLLKKDGEQSVSEIGRQLNVTQQAASLHLKLLEEAGLVSARRDGTRHLFAVRPEGFQPVQSFVAEFWNDKLAELKGEIEGK